MNAKDLAHQHMLIAEGGANKMLRSGLTMRAQALWIDFDPSSPSLAFRELRANARGVDLHVGEIAARLGLVDRVAHGGIRTIEQRQPDRRFRGILFRGCVGKAAFGGEIEHLAAGHAAEARGPRQRLHQRDADRGIGMGLSTPGGRDREPVARARFGENVHPGTTGVEPARELQRAWSQR